MAGRNGQTTDNRNGQDHVEYVSISEETRRRYLNYAMSVITSRALPDVRDGLKPVQRRILYVMYHELHLTADSKTRKCAKICGDTTGNYHPHGESAVYEALARLAQDFSLRAPLVIGQGNFGSIMGLRAAAPRYTEAKLSKIAEELMSELRFQTVGMRPNYDGTRNEPIVLPARFPNLLVNGIQGIAVGMATSIPPHNLGECVKACIHLIENPDASVAKLMNYVKGPDFPLGGRIVTDRRELRQAYEEGKGSIKVRGEWRAEKTRGKDGKHLIIIESIPYEVRTGPLVAEIGELIHSRKLPQLLDVVDETSDKNGLRVTLEIKAQADPEAVMSYLYKHTAMEQNFSLNMTCLIPNETGALTPSRISLRELLQEFLKFRLVTIRKRFEFQLKQLEDRIHILNGFAIVFDGLDRALKIIRGSAGKQDAAVKLMKEFPLDEPQTMALLELMLYRISNLEIGRIREELQEKTAQAETIRGILASETKLWGVIKDELEELDKAYGEKRRTTIGSSEEIQEFDPTAYIVRENTNVVITREGWLKRVGRINNVESTRVREGDGVLSVVPATTLDNIIAFSNDGVAYTLPVNAIPASTGYGEPISKYVKLADGARIIAAISTDPRFLAEPPKNWKDASPPPWLLIVTAGGQVMQFPVEALRTPSNKSGRKYCRLADDDQVVDVQLVWDGVETLFLATREARVLHFALREIPILTNAGKGVIGIKLEAGDRVLGAVQLARPSDCLRVINENGKQLSFGQMKYGVTSRGGKGVRTSQRTSFTEIIRDPIDLVDWAVMEGQ